MILLSQIFAKKPKISPNKGPPIESKQKLLSTPPKLDVSPFVN